MIQQAGNTRNGAVEALRWNLDTLSMRPSEIRPPQDIRVLIQSVDELPPLPETARDLLQLLDRPDADAQDLAEVIGQDPLVANQIVRWANSAYYALRIPVDSVKEAIARVLGYEQALSLALGLTTLAPLETPRTGPVGRDAVWRHAQACSRLMLHLQALLPEDRRASSGRLQLTGLTQNIGYLLLGHLLPAQHAFLNRIIENNRSLSLPVVENFSLGVDHTQLGYWLLETWDMPGHLQTAVRHHHNPAYEGQHQDLVLLTCLADWLTAGTPVGLGPAPHEIPLHTLMGRLELEPEQCAHALAAAIGSS